MYQVTATMSHPLSKQRIKWTGIFMPKDKKVKVNRDKITEQTTQFCKSHIGVDASFNREQIKVKVEITKIKCDFFIVEDKID